MLSGILILNLDAESGLIFVDEISRGEQVLVVGGSD
jgi:hypothetical protein